MSTQPLPWFDRPPVVETILGVQFDPIKGLTNAHLGSFWSQLGSVWPKVQDAPKLEPQVEEFSQEQTWAPLGARLTFSQDLSSRLQIRNQDENRMIQVQNGRFHYNWFAKSNSDYPRYNVVRPEFDLLWRRFLSFLGSENFKTPSLNQWEVTYVNQLPLGTVWNRPADWGRALPGLLGCNPAEEVARFESFGGQWHYEIPPRRGRLHVQIVHGRRADSDAKEIARMDLTARGPIPSDPVDANALGTGLDLGRETIVRMFVALTSQAAHDFWGIHDA
jgi:uncharacterized protein (TIGR04255 family)